MVQQESSEAYWARHKEAERIITSIKGPRPEPTEARDSIFGATAGGVSAMLALALAGVHGERFDYITLTVAGIAGGSVFLCRRFQQRDWQRAWMNRMSQTAPEVEGQESDRTSG